MRYHSPHAGDTAVDLGHEVHSLGFSLLVRVSADLAVESPFCIRS